MKRWRSWLVTLAMALGVSTAAAQPPGFTPPMPTPSPGPFTPPSPTPFGAPSPYFGAPGEPTPLGPSMMGAGPAPVAGPPAAGPGVTPSSDMLTLQNRPNAFDDETPASLPGWGRYCSFSVDFLTLRTNFDRNPAYSVFANGQAFSRDFDFPETLVPKLTLDLQFGDYFGVRGSWMRMENSASPVFIGNSDPNIFVSTPSLLPGTVLVNQVDQTRIGGVFQKDNRTVLAQNVSQIVSPRPFFFPSLLPTQSLLPPVTKLPAFTLSSAVQAGFPDFFAIGSSLRTEVADLELTHAIEFNSWTGTFGLGLRYGHISQNYSALRANNGGSNTIPKYDPFVTIVIDAVIFTRADYEQAIYGSTFGGVGPKLSFEWGTDITPFARIYGKVNGSVLMGNRKQVLYYASVQNVNITDVNPPPQADIFEIQTAAGQQAALKNSFTVVPLAEAEAGVEVGFGGRFFPILRVGAFGQAWINGGNAANPNANLFVYGVNASLGFGF